MRKYPIEDPAIRFWRHVDIPVNKKKCWLWAAGTVRGDYGAFSIRHKTILAHHFSYELYHGQIPDGLFILHNCNNPICVNPKHLYAGTHQNNMDDMVRSGRQATGKNNGKYTMPEKTPRGEQNGIAKLSNKQVLEIRSKYSPYKYSTYKLANEYNVHQALIWRIVNGKSWTHI